MGKILGVKKIGDEKVNITLEVSNAEALWLKGHMEKIYIFGEANLDLQTKLVQRGKKHSTRYFLIPRLIKTRLASSDKVQCSKMETKTKEIYIFSVNKI